jgi:hypothetical protein
MKQNILPGKSELIPVHVSATEIKFMDEMQKLATGHKETVDPHTGLRAYPGLSTLIANPETHRMFKGALHAMKTNAQMPPDVQKVYRQTRNKIAKKKLPAVPSDKDLQVKIMRRAGEGDDKELVMMPLDVVEYLDKLEGTKKKESKFGLQEFAFFDNVFDMVGSALHAANKREHHFWGEVIAGGSMLLGAWLNHQADEEEQEEYEKEKRYNRQQRAESAARWNKGGLQFPIMIPGSLNRYTQRGLDEPKGGNFGTYKKGGMVLGKVLKGPGHGQEDLIHKDIPENTWIHDAHTVGNWGNGTTEHGQKVIESLEKFAVKKLLTPEVKEKFKMQVKEKPLRKVPCAVANGERETPPLIVAALGGGSNDTGANILRDMTETLRMHKISKGHKLPPPAPDIIHLYKRAAHKHGMEV